MSSMPSSRSKSQARTLLGHQLALQPVGEAADRALQVPQLLVEEGPQPLQLVGRREVLGGDLLVVLAAEDLVSERFGAIENVEIRAPLARVAQFLEVGIGIGLVEVGVLGRIDGLAFLALAALLVAGLILCVLPLLLVLDLLVAAFRLLLVTFLALAFRELV